MIFGTLFFVLKLLLFQFLVIVYIFRFTSLSVGCEGGSMARLSSPIYGGALIPAMSHTFINQYTGSEFNLDKPRVR